MWHLSWKLSLSFTIWGSEWHLSWELSPNWVRHYLEVNVADSNPLSGKPVSMEDLVRVTIERELVEGGVKDGRPAEDTRPAPDDPVVEKVTMRQNISGINKWYQQRFQEQDLASFLKSKQGQMPIKRGRNDPVPLTLSSLYIKLNCVSVGHTKDDLLGLKLVSRFVC